ncbi:MAG: peptide chain release factor N(5)-glutamine methyltransferase [Bdellovibrionales bacterium]
MKLKEVLDKTIQFYRDRKFENPRLEAEWLFASALKLDRVQLYLKFDQPLAEPELNRLRHMIRRRTSGEPLAYITGSRGFYGFEFEVTPDVLIPRPETETLVEKALEKLKSFEGDSLRVLDLGCGSGCIGLTLAKKDSRLQVGLIDVSEGALQVAQRNAQTLGVHERCHFFHEDALTFLQKAVSHYDLIVANPPYIRPHDPQVEDHVKKYEPELALYAPEGTSKLKTWSEAAASKLSAQGLMLMEMGHDQGPEMKKHFEALGRFQNVEVIQDLSHHDRVILGELHG